MPSAYNRKGTHVRKGADTDTTTVNMSLHLKLLARIDRCAEQLGYGSRSHFIREAVEMLLKIEEPRAVARRKHEQKYAAQLAEEAAAND